MSDKLYTIPIENLLAWILDEEKQGKIFGYYKILFFVPDNKQPFKLMRFGHNLSTPLGVAAGPHTQLSQNIILSWLFGARYIELKTIQVLDEIKVKKPCIDIYDEGYNCEWSQELKIKQSFDEYLNAWIIIHILKDKFGWNDIDDFVFNMSIGYDLKGIKSPAVQWFLDKMQNAENEIAEIIDRVSKHYPRIKELNIPKTISDNVTLSTMHGCPPDEIESIGKYLITEKKLHTVIKLNPTLLGQKDIRHILNEKLNYNISVPDSAFEHDLKYAEAIRIIRTLENEAAKENVKFGLKLTNTLESLNGTKSLPTEEKTVYMSGRALHPISINLAAKLQNDFNGKLDISFSAGVDAFNFSKTLSCGLNPITVCSDLLKPGGYSRLTQYLSMLNDEMQKHNAKNLIEFINVSAEENQNNYAALKNLNEYAQEVLNDKRYNKSFFKHESIKTERMLTPTDCIQAPCIESCAISQNVPDYMYHTANKNFEAAFSVIAAENPLPNITGMVCDHLCQAKCTRMNIDNSLLIREIKRFISAINIEKNPHVSGLRSSAKIAIIGAGPSGLSAAYFLIQAGFSVDIFEEKSFAGGMVSDAIPKFRIDKSMLLNDVEAIKSLGVIFHFGFKITKISFMELRNNFNYIYVAVGAQKGKKLNIEGENLPNVFDQINFLEKVNSGKNIFLGESVAVIGGGNSAIDAARTAKRIVGNSGNVTVIYRRTRKEMPADREEIEALFDEKIKLLELTVPERILKFGDKLKLQCSKIELRYSEEDRRGELKKISNSEFELLFDSIITAIGQDTNIDFYNELDSVSSSSYQNKIFVGGDFKRGADSLINAIADGKNTAEVIIKKERYKTTTMRKNRPSISLYDFQNKISKRIYGHEQPSLPLEERNNFNLVHPILEVDFAVKEASRCLMCNDICNICVSVCPNIANQYFISEPTSISYPIISLNDSSWHVVEKKLLTASQKFQIINIADFCNECGNCDTFCPTSGAPYKIKPRFSLCENSFLADNNIYLLRNNEIRYKINSEISILSERENIFVFSNSDIEIIFDKFFTVKSIIKLNENVFSYDLQTAAQMYYYYLSLKSHPLFANNPEVEL